MPAMPGTRELQPVAETDCAWCEPPFGDFLTHPSKPLRAHEAKLHASIHLSPNVVKMKETRRLAIGRSAKVGFCGRTRRCETGLVLPATHSGGRGAGVPEIFDLPRK